MISRRALRWIISILLVTVVVLAGWSIVLRRPSVKLVVPTGADRIVLRDTTTAKVAAQTTKETRVRLDSGSYTATYYKDKTVVGVQTVTISSAPRQTVMASIKAPPNKLLMILHQRADLVVPLGDGYLYLNKATRGVEFADDKGISDISDRFNLLQSPQTLADEAPTYNTVVNIEPVRNGSVAVTTTAAVFLLRNPGSITRLPAYDKAILNFTSSAYDSRTNRLFVLSSYNKNIFYYDLARLTSGPQVFYANKLEINRVAAGGGRVVAYFDAVPTLEPGVLAAYGIKRQVSPVIFDTVKQKAIATLDSYQGTTLVRIADDGHIALRRKFATSLFILDGKGRLVQTLPAPDTSALAWQGGTLYLGRDQALWKYKVGQEDAALTKVARAPGLVVRIMLQDNKLLVSLASDFTAQVVLADQDTSASLAEKVKDLPLKAKDYYISFIGTNDRLRAVIETPGDITAEGDAAVKAIEKDQYSRALAALGLAASSPNFAASQKDTYAVGLYQYAGTPTDSQLVQ